MTWRGRMLIVGTVLLIVATPILYLRFCLRYLTSPAGLSELEATTNHVVHQVASDLTVHLEQPQSTGPLSLVIPGAQITTPQKTEPLIDLGPTKVSLQVWPYLLKGQVQGLFQLRDVISGAEARVVVIVSLKELAKAGLGGATFHITAAGWSIPLLLRLWSQKSPALPLGIKADQLSGIVSGSADLVLKGGLLKQGLAKVQGRDLSVAIPRLRTTLRFAAVAPEIEWRDKTWGLVRPVTLADEGSGFSFHFERAVGGDEPLKFSIEAPPLGMMLLKTVAPCQASRGLELRLEDGQWRC